MAPGEDDDVPPSSAAVALAAAVGAFCAPPWVGSFHALPKTSLGGHTYPAAVRKFRFLPISSASFTLTTNYTLPWLPRSSAFLKSWGAAPFPVATNEWHHSLSISLSPPSAQVRPPLVDAGLQPPQGVSVIADANPPR